MTAAAIRFPPRRARFKNQSTCPCCGQPVVPETLPLPPVKRRILEAVRRHPGISAEGLRAGVWADDPMVVRRIARFCTFMSIN
jgi:hypothetical protein